MAAVAAAVPTPLSTRGKPEVFNERPNSLCSLPKGGVNDSFLISACCLFWQLIMD